MTKKHVSLLVVFVLLFTTLFSSFAFAADAEWIEADEITINVKSHVQSFGDQTHKGEDGMVAFGTEGKAKRLEKFDVTLEGAPADMELVGMAHVQSYGDMPKDGKFQPGAIGTSGEYKRIEGVAFKLVKKGTDTLYPGYRVAYAVHMQSFGWGISDKVNTVVGKNFDGAEDFAFDGTFAGTKGLAKRIESVSMIIYKEAKLAVKSVSADNLKQVVVEFNQAVDPETVVDGNFKLAAKGGSSVTTTAVLEDDNRTVVLTVKADKAGLTNQGKYVLTVEKVKTAGGKELEKAEVEFTAFDASLPEVEKIKVTGPRSFVIVFSEPIKQDGEVEVKTGNSTISVDSSLTGYNTNEIAVSLYSTLADGKVYDITVKGFEDFAGYDNVITTVELPYVKDVNPPVATIEKVEQEYVVVAFDKPVKGLSIGNFYHTFSAWKPVGIYSDADFKDAVTPSTSVSKVYVQFYKAGIDASRPIPEGSTYLTILGKVGSVEVKDNWGNALGTQELKISVAADKAKPEVTKVEVKSETSLTVEFNKNVNFEKADVEILDENGKAITGLRISAVERVDSSAKKYTVTFSKNLAGKTVIVNIEGVEDLTLAANKLVPYSTTIEITDKTAPIADRATVSKDTDKNALYVFFNESVDPDTALVSGNYYLVNGTTYTRLSKAASFFGGDKTVKITLTNDEAKLVNTTTTPTALFVTGIEDIAGNVLKAGYVTKIGLNTDTANVPKMTKAEATDVSTVKVTFDQELPKVDISAFTVNGTSPASMEVTFDGSKTIITLSLKSGKELDANVNVTTENAYVKIVDNTKIANAFDANPAANDTIAIADKIVPEIKTTTEDALVVERTSADAIEIEFNEPIALKSLSTLTFKVDNAKVEAIGVNGNRVKLTISDYEDMEEIRVTQQFDITDIKGNIFKADDVLEGVDLTIAK